MSVFTVEKDWITYAGFRGVVIIGHELGHRCGYVGVPHGHPLYGVAYHEGAPCLQAPEGDEKLGKRSVMTILAASVDGLQPTPEMVFDVHGSLTFARGGDYPVQNTGLWWFGFDAGHAGDAPEISAITDKATRDVYGSLARHGVVRTLEYMVKECESLALQIADKVKA
jgi:hypothetical protein